jgi:hypothetical protein
LSTRAMTTAASGPSYSTTRRTPSMASLGNYPTSQDRPAPRSAILRSLGSRRPGRRRVKGYARVGLGVAQQPTPTPRHVAAPLYRDRKAGGTQSEAAGEYPTGCVSCRGWRGLCGGLQRLPTGVGRFPPFSYSLCDPETVVNKGIAAVWGREWPYCARSRPFRGRFGWCRLSIFEAGYALVMHGRGVDRG